MDSGELAEKPKGLYATPARGTIPLLSADGRNFEFYGVGPLKLLTTIPIDRSTEVNAVEDWMPGDERVASPVAQARRDRSDEPCRVPRAGRRPANDARRSSSKPRVTGVDVVGFTVAPPRPSSEPWRSLIDPVLDYVDELLRENPEQVITVIVPEAVSTRWYHKLLQENVAQQLKSALGMRPNVVVTNVKYFLK